MSTAKELLGSLAKLGATVGPAGDQLLVRAGGKPIPHNLVKRLRELKAEMRELVLAEQAGSMDEQPAWWRRHYLVRTIDRGLSGYRPEGQARALAWGELMDEWRHRHGQRWPVSQCAGCGGPIGGLESLTLCDGNRVHYDRSDRLLAFGKHWRAEAAAGLRALGLEPPTGGLDR
jgi:hypothetical protein